MLALRRSCPAFEPTPTNSCAIRSVVSVFAGLHRLSPSETQILHHGAHGLCSKEIATVRDCSGKTVEALWARICRKSGHASQRQVLAALLYEAAGRRANPDMTAAFDSPKVAGLSVPMAPPPVEKDSP